MIKVLVIAVLASIGGLAVFWGLALEKSSDKKQYTDLTDLRSSKARATRGERLVRWGVFSEMVLAFGIAVWEGYVALKQDPLKKPVSSISAFARFSVQNNNIRTNLAFGEHIALASFNKPFGGFRPDNLIDLYADSVQYDSNFDEYRMYFLPIVPGVVMMHLDPGSTTVEGLTNKLNCARIDFSCFRSNVDFLRGSITLFINNDAAVMNFPIPAQKDFRGTVFTWIRGNKPPLPVPYGFLNDRGEINPWNLRHLDQRTRDLYEAEQHKK